MRHLNVSKARADLPSLVGSEERVVITRNGRPAAVLLSVDDFRVLRAAQELAKDPAAVARVHRAHDQVQRGDFSGFRPMDVPAERARLEQASLEEPRSKPAESERSEPLADMRAWAETEALTALSGAPDLREVIEQLGAAFESIALSLREQSRTSRGIERVLEEQLQYQAQLERMQAALKEETLAEARSAAAEEARHAVAEAISR